MASLHKRARLSTTVDESFSFIDGNDILIDDVLAKIIQSVPIAQWRQLETISRQFHRCVKTAYRAVVSVNLKNVFLATFGIYSVKEGQLLKFLKKLAQYCPLLHTISGFNCLSTNRLRFCGALITNSILELLQQFPELRNISFEDCYLKKIGDFSRCLKCFPRMKTLEIRDCRVWNHSHRPRDTGFNDSVYFDFFEQFSGLTELTLAGFDDQFSGNFLSTINACHLKLLNFSESKFDGTYVIELLNRCINLEVLHLFDPLTDYHSTRDGLELGVLQCLPKLPKLYKLQLRVSEMLGGDNIHLEEYTDDDLLSILVNCNCLRDLSLKCENSGLMTDHFVYRLCKGCPLLESLDLVLGGCYSKENVSKIADLQNLTSLSLCYNYRKDYEALNELCLKLDKLDKLSCLTIDAGSGGGSMELSWLKNLKYLTHFSFEGCGYVVTESIVQNWIENGFLKQLTTLKLSARINQSVVKLISENAPLLSRFCFWGEINDKTLLLISENCKHLKMLNFNSCSGISETGILNFLSNCSSLECLIIRDSYRRSIPTYTTFKRYKHIIWFYAEDCFYK